MHGGTMAMVPLELYELFEEKLGKEKAKEAIKLVEEALKSVEEKAREQKTIIKAELKDELRKELATKEDIAVVRQEIETVRQEIETVRQEIETVRQELKGEIKALDEKIAGLEGRIKGEIKVLKILIYVTILTVIFMNRGTIEYLVNLIKMMK
jgi:flagellar motility protein MotE (MotC chaperone)